MESNIQKAIFAGGCFWCTEAVFQNIKGVTAVTSGYIGGSKDEANYMKVSSGKTGHAESIQIEFDSEIISYKELLYVFFYNYPSSLHWKYTTFEKENVIKIEKNENSGCWSYRNGGPGDVASAG